MYMLISTKVYKLYLVLSLNLIFFSNLIGGFNMENNHKVIKIRNKEYTCSVELTLDIIGGKWKTLIL